MSHKEGCATLLGTAVVLATFMGVGYGLARDTWRTDAVEKGHAGWIITSPAGAVEFKWNPSCLRKESE
jgi:phosphate/sulfate permease